jgi:L-aspartate oxidase
MRADLAVVGAGAAGLYAALCAARQGARVLIVSATPLAEAASYWAQGGLAAALADGDSPERHFHDTIEAGRGAVRPSAARVLTREAPGVVADLEQLGVAFDADRHGRLALGLEGGHSARRITHAGGSATGRRITRQLSADVAEHPRITALERTRATALRTDDDGVCTGLTTDDGRTVLARAVILATGGAAALWSRTTNPAGTIGRGLSIAHAAGAALADLELVQFHPTAVAGIDGADGFLVTEAVRGEGARLLDAAGERFVDELAPRDEVARAIHQRMLRTGAPVTLDMRDVDAEHFPNVAAALRQAGLDPVRTPIPVAPAAHYVMGGIATDLDGRTTVSGLYAIGECACTGLHGANRLASNSLSECFVFGARAARAGLEERLPTAPGTPQLPAPETLEAPAEATREALWRDAGLDRDAAGLGALTHDPHPLARLVAACALARTESRGAHQRRDFPALDEAFDGRHLVVRPGADPEPESWD